MCIAAIFIAMTIEHSQACLQQLAAANPNSEKAKIYKIYEN